MSEVQKSIDLISEAVERYSARKVFVLFSGGNDSQTTLHIARQHPQFTAAVYMNTGVGVEATREFIHDTCKKIGCPLIEYCATKHVNAKGQPDPQMYDQMVMEQGFPGPTKFGHGKMYSRLKERGIQRLFREHREKGERLVLVSGCRSDESTRRMGTTEPIQEGDRSKRGRINKARIWVAAIHDWSKSDIYHYQQANRIEVNPVTKLICKSGECLCGAFGTEGELEELTLFPETRPLGLRLLELQRRVLEAGFPWKWHERPPKWWLDSKRGQRMLFDMNRYTVPEGQSMCSGCEELRVANNS